MAWYENSEQRFGETGKKGDAGEQLVESYLIDNKIPYRKVTDRHGQVVQKIDFYVNNIPIDVKTNIYRSTLAVEIESANKPGWIFTTEAQYIWAVDLERERIYSYNVSKMLEHTKTKSESYRKVKNGGTVLWVPLSNTLITRIL